MAEIIEKILSLSKAERLKIAMQILLSIQEEEHGNDDWHLAELTKFQQDLSDGKVTYHSEKEFWADVHKRVS